jgi:hypothetical protein
VSGARGREGLARVERFASSQKRAEASWARGVGKMKRAIILMLVCVLAVTLVAVGLKRAQRNAVGPVAAKQAENLVWGWLKAHSYSMAGRHPNPELKDITTRDVRDRLHAQVFEVRDWLARTRSQLNEPASYLIRDGQVYPLGTSPFGPENLQTLVCDIDGDSKDELLYTYEWGGSCLSWGHVAAYRFNGPKPASISGGFQVMLSPIALKNQGKHVDAYISCGGYLAKPTKRRLGELMFVRHGKSELLDIKLDPNLPKECKKSVYTNPPSKM